jgi:hypothetical protein
MGCPSSLRSVKDSLIKMRRPAGWSRTSIGAMTEANGRQNDLGGLAGIENHPAADR